MSRFPFPHNRRLPHCSYPAAANHADVLRAFHAFRDEIVTAEGARGFLRTRRPDTPDGVVNSTVSEGIAYGMLIAVMLGEQALFDALYGYALAFANERGLMCWYVAPDGERALGTGAASDADEDIAWALVMADRQWGGRGALGESYLDHARRQIDRIWEHEVDHADFPFLFKPGDEWRPGVFNPSYFSPHQYRLFAEVSGNRDWLNVVDRGYDAVAASLNDASNNRENGLVPAWCDARGVPLEAFPGAETNYQTDSARLPFRLAQDFAYYADRRARAYVEKTSSFFAALGAAAVGDGYHTDGRPCPDRKTAQPNPGSAVFVGGAAAGAMCSPAYQTFLDEAYARLRTGKLLARSRYYNHCWTVLSLLMLTGNLVEFQP
ncbi:MAG TPA: glycosyl hydrolase family 8 [Polyangiaceae bacterium]|nr:glycosyl hydrolase family 8 [Polyangiaceae bacterium]